MLVVIIVMMLMTTVETAIHIKIRNSPLRNHPHNTSLEAETTTAEIMCELARLLDWSGKGITSWNDIETNLTSTVTNLIVSSNDLGIITFTKPFQELQTLLCSNASLTQLNVNMTTLETLNASNNLLSSFQDIVLPTTIETLDLSANQLSDWENFQLPRDLQTLNLSHNLIADISGSNLSAAVDLVSIDLSSNNLTSVVAVIFPSNLLHLDLSSNKINTFEVRQTDLAVLSNLTTFKMDDLEQSSCPSSSAMIETISNVQICVVSDAVFMSAYSSRESVWKADDFLLYISVIVSALISLWFVVLLVGHGCTRHQHVAKKNEQQCDKVEISTLTASRHWSQSREEELPNDVRFDENFTSFRIDPSDVMQIRTLAHGNFAMISLVHLGDKQAVMKKVSVHSQDQDRDQMIAFMNEICVCAKLDYPMVVGFLGIMWSSLSNLASIVEYVPRGSLAVYLKEKKSSQKNSRSTFSWNESSSESLTKLSFSRQISEALVYLQSFAPPVIHGHLKADSILLGSEWNAKLDRLGYTLDTSSLSIEDRAWIAPEVLTGNEVDEKSDIYSFGVVLSELDRCKLPFSRKTTQQQNVDDTVFLKPKFRKDCPFEILEIARSCLNDNPADRPTAMELYDSLRKISHPSQDHSQSFNQEEVDVISVS